jgi:hypothetical protein
LAFHDPVTGERLTIVFPVDCRAAAWESSGGRQRAISTEPIAAGLVKFFTDVWAETSQPTG